MNRASILKFFSWRKLLLILPVLLAAGALPYIPVAFEGNYREIGMVMDCGLDSRKDFFISVRDGRVVSYALNTSGTGTVELQYTYRTGPDGVVTLYYPPTRPGLKETPVMKAYPRLTGMRLVSMENNEVYRYRKFTPEGTTRKGLETSEIVSQQTYYPDSTTTREIYSPDFRLLRTEKMDPEGKWNLLTAALDEGKR